MSGNEINLKHLRFDLERSMRYHNIRAHFMRKRHVAIMGLIVAVAGTSVFGVADLLVQLVHFMSLAAGLGDAKWFDAGSASTLIGLSVAGLGTYDLLGGFAALAGQHLSFERVYTDMLAEAHQLSEGDTEAAKRLKFRSDAVSITSEGTYRVVNAFAHNQVMEAHGHKDHRVKINLVEKVFANYFLFSGSSFEKKKT